MKLHCEKKVVIKVDYNDIANYIEYCVEQKLIDVKLPIHNGTKKPEYEISCHEEWSNDTTHSFIIKKDDEIWDDDRKELSEGKISFNLHVILSLLLEKDLLEEAEYMINCSW